MPSPPDPLVTPFFLLVSLFQVLAAAAAVLLARRRVEHRPVALFLAGQVVANIAHEALRVLVLVPARAGGLQPFTGWTRAAGHLATALSLTWPAGLALVALIALARVRPRAAGVALIGAWALVSLTLAWAYPAARGPVLALALLRCELAGLAVSAAGVSVWAVRGERPPQSEHVAIVLLLVGELSALLVGPWQGDVFGDWPLAQMAYGTIYMVLVAIQGGYFLWQRSSK
jgi:hypothetical protein